MYKKDDDNWDQPVQLCLRIEAIAQRMSVVNAGVQFEEKPLANPDEYFKNPDVNNINCFQFRLIQHGKATEPLPFYDKIFHVHSGDDQTFKRNRLTYHIITKSYFVAFLFLDFTILLF